MARTLASLCRRPGRAVNRSLQRAARAPCTLLAAICSPWPLPPRTMPRSASPRTTALAAAAQNGGEATDAPGAGPGATDPVAPAFTGVVRSDVGGEPAGAGGLGVFPSAGGADTTQAG